MLRLSVVNIQSVLGQAGSRLYSLHYRELPFAQALSDVQPAKMQNDDGETVDLYIPRKW